MESPDRHFALDGLRGVAVIGVLLFHDGRLSGGFLGVDLFFGLSGFLITGLLLQEIRRTGSIDVPKFWERRFRRLLPAFLVFLVLIVPLMRWLGSAVQVDAARHGVIPALLYVANWHEIFQGSDYWALFTDPSPLTHLWSLAVEQQFYLVWPMVFLAVSRLRRWLTTITVACVAIIVTSGVLMWVLYDPASPNRSYEGTDTRASSILLGALAAIVGLPLIIGRLGREGQRWYQGARLGIEVGQWAIVAGLAWSWCTVNGASGAAMAHGGLLLHSAAGALLAASLASTHRTSLQRVLSIAPLRGAGAVSYGWYLWHWPIYIILTPARTGWHGWANSGARWSVSLAAAVVSYYLLEMPIRRRRVLRTARTALTGLAVAAVAVVAVVIVVPRPRTAPAAFDPSSVTLPSTTISPSTTPTTNNGSTPPTTPAATTPKRRIASIIWSGDSVAYDAAPGVIAAAGAAGLHAAYAGFPGTGLTPKPGIDTWKVFVQPVLDARPDVVIFQFSGWDSFFTQAQQRAAFDRYTTAVLGTGATLVFVTPPPMDSTKVHNDVAFMESAARQLAAAHPDTVLILDSSALWGVFKYDIEGDGIPDRKPDGVHFCPQGAAKYGFWLTVELSQRFDGVQPASPSVWAGGAWVHDPRYNNPLGACV